MQQDDPKRDRTNNVDSLPALSKLRRARKRARQKVRSNNENQQKCDFTELREIPRRQKTARSIRHPQFSTTLEGYSSSYVGTKFAIEGISESLRRELLL
jgi:hypothetical protein